MRQPGGHVKRQTSRAVYLYDRAAGAVITVGGVAVLAAVLGICVYLFATVLPLFKGGHAAPKQARDVVGASSSQPPLVTVLGESCNAALTLGADGQARLLSLGSGREVWSGPVASGHAITAVSHADRAGPIAIGLDDGSLQIGRLGVSSRLLRRDEVGSALRHIPVGGEQVIPAGDGGPSRLVEAFADGALRETSPVLEFRESQKAGNPPWTLLDLRESSSGTRLFVGLRSDGSGSFGTVRTITPLDGGPPRDKVTTNALTLGGGVPRWLFITSDGHSVLALWEDGKLERLVTGYGTEAGIDVHAVETAAVVAAPVRVTCAEMLLGGQMLLIGDSVGTVSAWDAARDEASPSPDGLRLVRSESFTVSTTNAPVVSLAVGQRDRIVAAATESGACVVRHLTSRKDIARVDAGAEAKVETPLTLAFSPKEDGLLAHHPDRFRVWSLELNHADASAVSLFAPIMYEGEAAPRYIYQSSSGSDAAEIKLSLVPLIFGTVKATVVGMLVAVPLAVLGAIYSSEFMHKRLRKYVKPAVEMMASLPSVVLGFIAAMVVAPVMRDWLAKVLVGIILTPVILALLAHLWQLVPRDSAAFVTRRARTLLIALGLLLSASAATLMAPGVERVLFKPTHNDVLVAAGSYVPVPVEQWPSWVGHRQTMSSDDERTLRREGLYFRGGSVVRPVEADVPATAAGRPDLQSWLNGTIGDAFPGWVVALFLPVMLVTWLAQARLIDRERFEQMLGTTRPAMAAAELLRLLLVMAASLGLTLLLALLLTKAGCDTRDSIFGPFSQRNALVVGVIMGFAVIPLVYTISEDALRSVPNSLRSASLGVGATPWQTAVRVVLPAAGSGVFSAIMIGLGRAVGETMIVLMATGNTPEMSFNIFSGFRTLAANIAVELPEADKGGTHYRVLFLCGLVLFVMTFAINTSAEVVRQRFRKRNAAL